MTPIIWLPWRLSVGKIYTEASKRLVLKVDVLEEGEMGECEDLNHFEQDQTVVSRRPGQNISRTAALVGGSWSAVVRTYQKWSKEGKVVEWRQGHGGQGSL